MGVSLVLQDLWKYPLSLFLCYSSVFIFPSHFFFFHFCPIFSQFTHPFIFSTPFTRFKNPSMLSKCPSLWNLSPLPYFAFPCSVPFSQHSVCNLPIHRSLSLIINILYSNHVALKPARWAVHDSGWPAPLCSRVVSVVGLDITGHHCGRLCKVCPLWYEQTHRYKNSCLESWMHNVMVFAKLLSSQVWSLLDLNHVRHVKVACLPFCILLICQVGACNWMIDVIMNDQSNKHSEHLI